MYGLCALASLPLSLLGGASAQATALLSFSSIDRGAIAGEDRFHIDGSTTFGRFVRTGLDDGRDASERPVVQQRLSLTIGSGAAGPLVSGGTLNAKVGDAVFGATGSSPTYFKNVDLVQGKFSFDNDFRYFHVDLFGEMNVGADGALTADFGGNRLYRIRISAGAGSAAGIASGDESAVGGDRNKPGSRGTIGGKPVLYAHKFAGQDWVAFSFEYVAFNNQRGSELDPTDGLPFWISRTIAAPTTRRATIETIKAGSTDQTPPSSMPAVFKAAAPSSSPKPVPETGAASPAISPAVSTSSRP